MYKGQEYSAVISDDISDAEDFTYRVYQKALTALDDIAKRTGELISCGKKGLCGDTLYRYSQNMIVFSGARGQGKTSAMLSFSKTLSDQKKLNSVVEKEGLRHLKDCGFLVMDPIDPTVLEQGQNLLALVLSRMLAYTERQWKDHTDYCGRFQDRSSERNKLLKLYQDCLNGINAVKGSRDGGVIKSLTDVHKISDSSVLKENFYCLAKTLLDNAFSDSSVKDKFLVLQFDDTDFQIARGYEVMEDIRKYLTVPNIVILMATDTDLLRKVLTQHYASEFNASLNRNLIESPLLSGISAKYLAKLVPPTYTAYMPHLEEDIRDQRGQITLEYCERDSDGNPGKNLISPEPDADAKTLSKYSLQDVVLRYIYKKTRLIFASHSGYMNNIIPTTLRGLAQLLSLLEFMENVPELPANAMNAPDTLVAGLKKQLPIIHRNLEIFEAYFTNDWIQAKLNVKQIDVIQKLAGQAPGQRIQYAASALEEYYKCSDGKAVYSDYSDLEKLIVELKESHRQPEDYYFLFAIHTLLTIENNKTILEIKQNTCTQWKQGSLVFYYLTGESSLPRYFYLPNKRYQLSAQKTDIAAGHLLVNTISKPDVLAANMLEPDEPTLKEIELSKAKLDKDKLDRYLKEPHFSYWAKPTKKKYKFSFLGLLTSAMNPAPTYYKGYNMAFMPGLYQLQELACAVAANADVRERVRKCFQDDLISRTDELLTVDDGEEVLSASADFVDTVDYAYRNIIFPEIAAINTPSGGEPMNGCFAECRSIGVTNILRSFIPGIQTALTGIGTGEWADEDAEQEELGLSDRENLESVLVKYYQLAMSYIESKNRSGILFLTSAQQIISHAPTEKQALLSNLSIYLVESLDRGISSQKAKMRHNKKLSDFCTANGIDYKTIKNAH